MIFLNNQVIKTVAENRRARHEYSILETIEAGIELKGTEVKSVRCGRISIKDSWCNIVKGEIFANNVHIAQYEYGNIFNHDPLRVRKLLIHRREIDGLFGKVKQKGYSIIPISAYFKGSILKLKIGLCRGKKLYDKREDEARKDAKRKIDRALKEYRKSF